MMMQTYDPSTRPLMCAHMTRWKPMTFYPSSDVYKYDMVNANDLLPILLFIWCSPKALSLGAVRFERESFWGFGTRGRGPGNHGFISSSCCLKRCFWTALASLNPRGQSPLKGLCLSDSQPHAGHPHVHLSPKTAHERGKSPTHLPLIIFYWLTIDWKLKIYMN